MACNLEYKGREYSSVFELGQAIARENGMGQRAEKLYSAHLQNWTKGSVVQDVLYHGSSTKLDKYRINMKAGGMWFSPDKDSVINFSKSIREIKDPVVNAVVVNIKNPKEFPSWDFYLGEVHFTGAFKQETSEKAQKNGKDGIFIEESLWNDDPENPYNSKQYVVFDPKQILVLGSDEDVEAFKEFAKNPIYPEELSLSSLNSSGDSSKRFEAKKARLIQYIKNHPNLRIEEIIDMLVGDSDFTERDVRELFLHLADSKMTAKEFADKAHNNTINNKITKEHLKYFINILNRETSITSRFTSATLEEHVARALVRFMPDNNLSTFRNMVADLIRIKKGSTTFGIDSTDMIALWLYKGLLERDLEANETSMTYDKMQELLEAKKQMQRDVLEVINNASSDAGLTLRLVGLLSSNLSWDSERIEARFIEKFIKEHGTSPTDKQIQDIRTLSKKIKQLEDEYALTLKKAANDFEKSSEATAEAEVKERVTKAKKEPKKGSVANVTADDLTQERKDAIKALMNRFENNFRFQKEQDDKAFGLASLNPNSTKVDDANLGTYYALINTLINEVITATIEAANRGDITDLNTNLPAIRREVNKLLKDIHTIGAWPTWLPPFEDVGKVDIHGLKSAIISSTVTNRKLLTQEMQGDLDRDKKIKAVFDSHIAELNTLLNKSSYTKSDITNIEKNIRVIEHFINKQRGKGIPMSTIHEMASSMVAVNGAATRIRDGIRMGNITAQEKQTHMDIINQELTSVLNSLRLTQAHFDEIQDIIGRLEDPNDYRVFDKFNPSLKLKDVYRRLNDLGDEIADAKEDALGYIDDLVTRTTGFHKVLDFINNITQFKRAVTLTMDVSMFGFQGGLLTLAFIPGLLLDIRSNNKTIYPIFKRALKDTWASIKHPITTALTSAIDGIENKDFIAAARMQSDQKKALELYNATIDDDMQPIRDMAGLVVNKPGAAVLNRREEFFRSRWVDKLPLTFGLFAASESGFTTYLNALRVAIFDKYVELNKDASDKELQQWAGYVNMITGVGIPGIEKMKLLTTGLNVLLTAPRLYYSMLSTLTHLGIDPLRAVKKLIKGDKKDARVYIYRSIASWGLLLNAYAIGLIIGTLLGGDDEDPIDFIASPSSSDFLAIKYKRSRIDMTPYTSYLRLGIRLTKTMFESHSPMGIGYGKGNAVDKFLDFWVAKGTPALGDLITMSINESFGGVPYGQHFKHTLLGQALGGQQMHPFVAKGLETIILGYVPYVASIAVSSAIKDDAPFGVSTLSLMGLPTYTAGSKLEDIRVEKYLDNQGIQPKDARISKPKKLTKDEAYVWEEIADKYMGDWLLEQLESNRKPSKEEIRRKASELRPKVQLKYNQAFGKK